MRRRAAEAPSLSANESNANNETQPRAISTGPRMSHAVGCGIRYGYTSLNPSARVSIATGVKTMAIPGVVRYSPVALYMLP